MKLLLLDDKGRFVKTEVSREELTMETVYRMEPIYMATMERKEIDHKTLYLKGEVIKAVLARYIHLKFFGV